VVGFERYDFACDLYRQRMVNQEIAYDPAGKRLDSLPNVATGTPAEWRDADRWGKALAAARNTICAEVRARWASRIRVTTEKDVR
jgi:hypothetical protein